MQRVPLRVTAKGNQPAIFINRVLMLVAEPALALVCEAGETKPGQLTHHPRGDVVYALRYGQREA